MGVDTFNSQYDIDAYFIGKAQTLAQQTANCVDANKAEVPVAALVVKARQVIGQGINQTITHCDPSAHAEIVAIRDACANIGNHRLNNCTLYVTLEPCIMCAGAILQARIERLVFATRDERFGAAGSVINVLESPFLNHQCKVIKAGDEEQSRRLLQNFFQKRRH